MKTILLGFIVLAMAGGCQNRNVSDKSNDNMDFMTLAQERYSVRKFKDAPIGQEKLDLILKAGQIAPSAVNAQPQKVYVFRSAEALEKVDELTPSRYGAPVVLMVAYDKGTQWKNRREDGFTTGVQDASIAATHMMLEAWNIGIGSVWVCGFSPTAAKLAFNLPESEEVVMMLPIGYAADDATPSPMHFKRKPIEDLVKYL